MVAGACKIHKTLHFSRDLGTKVVDDTVLSGYEYRHELLITFSARTHDSLPKLRRPLPLVDTSIWCYIDSRPRPSETAPSSITITITKLDDLWLIQIHKKISEHIFDAVRKQYSNRN